MNLEELEAKLLQIGYLKLLQVIRDFEKGKVSKIPQDHKKATYVQKIDSSMAEINWKESAEICA